MTAIRPLRRLALLAGMMALGAASLAASSPPAPMPMPTQTPMPRHPSAAVTPAGLLVQPISDDVPNAAELRRGQYLVRAGDCVSCHLRDGGQPLSGGLALGTPFGVIFSANITPDVQTGIGAWTAEQFYRAMHDGKGVHGENLYPALPYPWFRTASRADDDAIFAYLKSLPAVRYTPPPPQLPFPLNLRFLVKAWNVLFLRGQAFQPDPSQSAQWNRGAYLVNGYAHCGGCHTPKNFLGADRSGKRLQGGALDNWVAPDLSSNPRTGLGAWRAEDIAEYLKTGRNAYASAGGSMAEVVTYSTSLMSDADRLAIAVYLKSQPATAAAVIAGADPDALTRGAAIYSDACASCHLENGVGQPRLFPPLGHNALLQQSDPRGLLHIILAGSQVGASPARPSALTMPSFAWKLTDPQIADLATFVRNSWGNQAAAVKTGQVRDMRRKLGLDHPRQAASSGD